MSLIWLAHLSHALLSRLEQFFLQCTQLPPTSSVPTLTVDLIRPKRDLVWENALLRQWHIPRAIWGTLGARYWFPRRRIACA